MKLIFALILASVATCQISSLYTKAPALRPAESVPQVVQITARETPASVNNSLPLPTEAEITGIDLKLNGEGLFPEIPVRKVPPAAPCKKAPVKRRK